MNSSFDRPEPTNLRKLKPKSVSIKVVPNSTTGDWEVEVESSLEQRSVISALLMSVAKLMPHLNSRRIKKRAEMRKLMTASVKNQSLWDAVPEGEVMEQRLTMSRVGDRVRVTTHANVSPDCVQASWHVICPVMTPQMEGTEAAREICVVADSD